MERGEEGLRIPGIPACVGVGIWGTRGKTEWSSFSFTLCWHLLYPIPSRGLWHPEIPLAFSLSRPLPPTHPYPSQSLRYYPHPLTSPLLFPRPVFLCGGDVTGDSGYVASEGFPNLYPPNKECIWTITVRDPSGHHCPFSQGKA